MLCPYDSMSVFVSCNFFASVMASFQFKRMFVVYVGLVLFSAEYEIPCPQICFILSSAKIYICKEYMQLRPKSFKYKLLRCFEYNLPLRVDMTSPLERSETPVSAVGMAVLTCTYPTSMTSTAFQEDFVSY